MSTGSCSFPKVLLVSKGRWTLGGEGYSYDEMLGLFDELSGSATLWLASRKTAASSIRM